MTIAVAGSDVCEHRVVKCTNDNLENGFGRFAVDVGFACCRRELGPDGRKLLRFFLKIFSQFQCVLVFEFSEGIHHVNFCLIEICLSQFELRIGACQTQAAVREAGEEFCLLFAQAGLI